MFSKYRDRLLTTDIARKFLAAILAHAQVAPLLSDEHFSVDGTLITAWASMKSFQRRADGSPPDGGPDDPSSSRTEDAAKQSKPEPTEMTRRTLRSRNAEVDFRGEKRSNTTHASTTDPDARLVKKSPGAGAMLCFMGHTLMENRNGLVMQADLTQAHGRAERRAAIDMIDRHSPGSTVDVYVDPHARGGQGLRQRRFRCRPAPDVRDPPCRARKVRHSAIDGRTTRHAGYAASQKRRKKIEEPFGWAKSVGGMAQTTLRGVERVRARFTLTMAACNLARLPRLLAT